jgi:hypothetical protein
MGEKSDRIGDLAKQRAKERNISYSQALTEIGREYPKPCEEAREEVLGVTLRREHVGELEVLVIGTNPHRQLQQMTKVRMQEEGKTYKAALVEICTEHPQLHEAARQQVLNHQFSEH